MDPPEVPEGDDPSADGCEAQTQNDIVAKRRRNNKISANKARKKRKDALAELEQEVSVLVSENAELLKTLPEQEQENVKLRNELFAVAAHLKKCETNNDMLKAQENHLKEAQAGGAVFTPPMQMDHVTSPMEALPTSYASLPAMSADAYTPVSFQSQVHRVPSRETPSSMSPIPRTPMRTTSGLSPAGSGPSSGLSPPAAPTRHLGPGHRGPLRPTGPPSSMLRQFNNGIGSVRGGQMAPREGPGVRSSHAMLPPPPKCLQPLSFGASSQGMRQGMPSNTEGRQANQEANQQTGSVGANEMSLLPDEDWMPSF